jgi:hypothetical protein
MRFPEGIASDGGSLIAGLPERVARFCSLDGLIVDKALGSEGSA